MISMICDMMNEISIGKVMFTEVHHLFYICLTVPMTSTTPERAFFRRLKNYMQVTMTQKCLNNVIILRTHKDRTDALNLVDIGVLNISFHLMNKAKVIFGHYLNIFDCLF